MPWLIDDAQSAMQSRNAQVSRADSDHRRQQRPAGEMGGEIVAHQLAHRLARLDRAAGVMRLHDDGLEAEQARVDVRFVPEDVERGAAEALLLEVRRSARFVDHRAARDVDE